MVATPRALGGRAHLSFGAQRRGSLISSTRQGCLMIFERHQGTGLSSFVEVEKDSTAFESTSSFGYVSSGSTPARTRWRLLTTTEAGSEAEGSV